MTPEEIDALANRFFEAIMAGDVDTVRRCYAADAVVWHNYDKVDQPRADNLRVLAWLCQHVDGLRYEEIRRIVLPDGFVQQHVLRGTTAGGAALEVPAMMRVFVGGDGITRLEEYLDTAQVAHLRAARSTSG